ncbi:MAG: hypothetical protein WCW14_00640 [Candidatus Paceibacterota bacterium]
MAFQSSYQIRNIPHLRTGLNNRYDAGEIADTDMADLENVEVDTRSIRSAAGYVDYGGNTGPFYGGFHAKFSGGTNRLIRQRGAILEYDNGSGTWTACTLPSTGSPAATIVLAEIPCSFEMLNDIVLWSNGTTSVLSSTDGITWTERATLPKAKILFNNGLNRILFLAQPTLPSRVDWSDINDPLTVGASSYQFFGKNDGQNIEDAVLLPNGGMVLFKTSRFYSISDISLDTVSTEPVGEAPCVGRTAVVTENSVMWAGPDGSIYELQGGVPHKITNHITPIAVSYPYLMRGVYFNGKYHLSVPSSTDAYNSYEYVVDRTLPTGNPDAPYTITKNQRYIGCYIKEDREVSNVRRTRLYFGDGRTSAVGSPAAVPDTFAYINDRHDTSVTQGLNGVTQPCFFVTKFFMESNPYFLKRYTKYFIDLKSSLDQEITISYRFDQYESWVDSNILTEAADIDWLYDNGESGGFSEGYSFSNEAEIRQFKDLESTGTAPYGIQFKISWSSVVDVEILSQAYRFLTNRNFK